MSGNKLLKGGGEGGGSSRPASTTSSTVRPCAPSCSNSMTSMLSYLQANRTAHSQGQRAAWGAHRTQKGPCRPGPCGPAAGWCWFVGGGSASSKSSCVDCFSIKAMCDQQQPGALPVLGMGIVQHRAACRWLLTPAANDQPAAAAATRLGMLVGCAVAEGSRLTGARPTVWRRLALLRPLHQCGQHPGQGACALLVVYEVTACRQCNKQERALASVFCVKGSGAVCCHNAARTM